MTTVDRPQHVPSQRELDDLELMGVGGLGPIDGFGRDGGHGVTLVVPQEFAGSEHIELLDPEGAPRGVVTVEGTYPDSDGWVGISGSVEHAPGAHGRPFADFYVTPRVVKEQSTPETTLCVVDGPPSVADLASLETRAAGRPVVFLVLAGEGAPRETSAPGLVRTVIAAAERIPNARVVVTPAARRSRPEHEARFRDAVARAYAPGSDIVWASGTGTRDPEIERLTRLDRPLGARRGLIVFFTGLSGSGKSTLASALADHLVETGTRTVSLLDGDRVRRNLSRGLSFSPEDRDVNVERIGWVAAEVARHGGVAICSPIAPFDHTRKRVRAMAMRDGSAFVLVHVSTSLAECEQRDRKGLYAQARRGEITDFTGISSPYEEPTDAEVVVDTAGCTVADGLREILDDLTCRGLIEPGNEDTSTAQVGWRPCRE